MSSGSWRCGTTHSCLAFPRCRGSLPPEEPPSIPRFFRFSLPPAFELNSKHVCQLTFTVCCSVRQILADVFQCEVLTIDRSNAAVRGAVARAIHGRESSFSFDGPVPFADIGTRLRLQSSVRIACRPNEACKQVYNDKVQRVEKWTFSTQHGVRVHADLL